MQLFSPFYIRLKFTYITNNEKLITYRRRPGRSYFHTRVYSGIVRLFISSSFLLNHYKTAGNSNPIVGYNGNIQ